MASGLAANGYFLALSGACAATVVAQPTSSITATSLTRRAFKTDILSQRSVQLSDQRLRIAHRLKVLLRQPRIVKIANIVQRVATDAAVGLGADANVRVLNFEAIVALAQIGKQIIEYRGSHCNRVVAAAAVDRDAR